MPIVSSLATALAAATPAAAQEAAFGPPETVLPAGRLGFDQRVIPLPVGGPAVVATLDFEGPTAVLGVGPPSATHEARTLGGVGAAVPIGRASVLVVTARPDGRLLATRRGPTGRLGRRELVMPGAAVQARYGLRIPVLAGDGEGQAVVAVIRELGTRRREFLAAVRAGGKGFDRPFRVARGQINQVAVAIGPAGELLLAWQEDGTGAVEGRVFAQLRRPGRRAGPAVRLGPGFVASSLNAAFAPDGRAYVAWQSQAVFGEGGGQRGGEVLASTARPGATRMARARVLDASRTFGYYVDGRFQLAVSRAGAAIAWPQRPQQPDPGERPGFPLVGTARVSVAGRDGRFGPVQTLSSGSYEAAHDVALAPDGEVAVLYGDGLVRSRSPGRAAFGPPERLGGDGALLRGDLAFEDTGRLLALYARRAELPNATLLLARRR